MFLNDVYFVMEELNHEYSNNEWHDSKLSMKAVLFYNLKKFSFVIHAANIKKTYNIRI